MFKPFTQDVTYSNWKPLMPPWNRQNITVAKTMVTNVAVTAPIRKRKRRFAGRKVRTSAANKGMQMMAVSMCLAMEHHEQHDRDACGEQEGVSLSVAGL